jgi:hypothetical protein
VKASANSVSSNINNIPMLDGTNFKHWKETLMIVLGCMDLDLALRVECPPALTDTSTSDAKRDLEKWERSNCMCLMIMKHAIPESFRGTTSEEDNAKRFLVELEKRFEKNEKAETITLLTSLVSMRYKATGNIREYIMEMSHIASKLKALKLSLPEDLLVHLVLISLPNKFGQFKISYNCQKEKWSLNELISHCVQEEERLKQDKTESAHLASTSKGAKKRKHNDKGKEVAVSGPQKKQNSEKKEDKVKGCFFCDAVTHVKKQCPGYHAWRAKKGMFHSFVCSEVNLSSVPRHTWWIDSGATTHISVSMQGCLHCRTPVDGERYIYVGDGKAVKVEAIGTFRLLLKTGSYLDLKETFVVPSFRRNLVSVSTLDKFGYFCSFGDNKFSLFHDSKLVASGSLSGYDNLYLLDTVASSNETSERADIIPQPIS